MTFRSYCIIQKQTEKRHQPECREFLNQLIFAYPWMKDIIAPSIITMNKSPPRIFCQANTTNDVPCFLAWRPTKFHPASRRHQLLAQPTESALDDQAGTRGSERRKDTPCLYRHNSVTAGHRALCVAAELSPPRDPCLQVPEAALVLKVTFLNKAAQLHEEKLTSTLHGSGSRGSSLPRKSVLDPFQHPQSTAERCPSSCRHSQSTRAPEIQLLAGSSCLAGACEQSRCGLKHILMD